MEKCISPERRQVGSTTVSRQTKVSDLNGGFTRLSSTTATDNDTVLADVCKPNPRSGSSICTESTADYECSKKVPLLKSGALLRTTQNNYFENRYIGACRLPRRRTPSTEYTVGNSPSVRRYPFPAQKNSPSEVNVHSISRYSSVSSRGPVRTHSQQGKPSSAAHSQSEWAGDRCEAVNVAFPNMLDEDPGNWPKSILRSSSPPVMTRLSISTRTSTQI